MRIQLTITEDNLITLSMFVRSGAYHNVYGNIRFVIDTGSSNSFISEADAGRIRSPITKLMEEKEIIGRSITGEGIGLLKLRDVSLTFLDEEKRNKTLIYKVFKIGLVLKSGKYKILDSILGTDFLLENGFQLVFNPSKRIAYLEN